jgi:hypothetical protein
VCFICKLRPKLIRKIDPSRRKFSRRQWCRTVRRPKAQPPSWLTACLKSWTTVCLKNWTTVCLTNKPQLWTTACLKSWPTVCFTEKLQFWLTVWLETERWSWLTGFPETLWPKQTVQSQLTLPQSWSHHNRYVYMHAFVSKDFLKIISNDGIK